MNQIDKEEAVQKALGTLLCYKVSIYGPQGGSIGRPMYVDDAITPARAIYYAWRALSTTPQKRFLSSHKYSFINWYDQCCSACILVDGYDYGGVLPDLRLVLNYYGNVREDMSKETLRRLECVQKGIKYE